MLATVSSDSSSAVSTPPTSPDHASGTSTGHAPMSDHYRRKTTAGKPDAHRSAQSGTRDPFRDVEPDHYSGKADKKAKEKDVKFYQKILSSTGLDRLSKSASSTGLPKTAVYKEKSLKHGHDEPTLSPVRITILFGGATRTYVRKRGGGSCINKVAFLNYVSFTHLKCRI